MVECDQEHDPGLGHGKEIDVGPGVGSIYVVIVNVIGVDRGEISHRHRRSGGTTGGP